MVTCEVFVGDGTPGTESPFKVRGEGTSFHRVPIKGEIISFGNDKDGVALVYEVVLVDHRTEDDTVEIYAVRVDLTDKIGAVAPKTPWRNPRSPR